MLCKDNHILVIGAQKAGTTWLQHVFDCDSRLCTSVDQEVHFFDQEKVPQFEKYCGYFPNCSKPFASADVTPAYLTSRNCLPALKAFENSYNFMPKVVVVLREPVQRAFSAYQMFLRYDRNIGQFFQNLEEGNTIYEKSLYGKYLKHWVESGYESRMHLILFDDLVDNPQGVLDSLTHFIGLPSLVDGGYLGHPVNVGGMYRSRFFPIFRKWVGKILRRLGMHGFLHALKRASVIQWLDKVNKRRVSLDSGSKELAKRIFEEDVDQLDRLFPNLNVKERWGYETSARSNRD